MAESIPKTMKAVRLVEYGKKYEIKEIEVPKIGENDILVKVGAAGFCHTDYQVWEGVYGQVYGFKPPLTPSHEPVGTIVAVGPKAQSKWKVGQRVGVSFFRHQCHHCVGCETTKDIRWCENKELGGLAHDGGMAEYILGDADTTVLLPENLPFEQAAPLMCAGATVWGGLMQPDIPPSQPIGIVGIGGLGSLAVQFAKALGHPVVAIDNRPEGRALAKEVPLPADLVVDSNDSEALDKIKAWAGRGGLPAIIVCTDNVPVTKWSIKALKPHGVCVPLGLPTAGFSFDAFDTVFGAMTIRGSLVASTAQIQDMMKVVGRYGVLSHITTVPLEKAPELPSMYMDPHLKGRLVLTP